MKDRLNCDSLHVQPRWKDWSKGYGETWESWEDEECPECRRVLIGAGEIACETSGCSGTVYLEGPMMNYFYPVPDLKRQIGAEGPEEAARKLADLPLCLIQLEDTDDQEEEYGLALTCGGLDLRWEICAAYVALGYMPPRHFWDVPKMAGYTLTPQRRRVLAAIADGIRTDRAWLENDSRRLREIRAYLRENATNRRER